MKKLALLALPLLLVACSKDKNEDGGPCDWDVISDYNTLASNCNMERYSSGYDCNASIDSFLAKYPDVNCTAVKSSGSSVDGTEVHLTRDYVNSLRR